MAKNVYLQLEFKTGNLYQYSKDPADGFEQHINKNNKISYRKYWKEGVYGVYRGTTVRKTDFGKEISIHLIDVNGQNIYINFQLFDQQKNIAAYAESFIALIPGMEMNYVYRVFPYAMEKEGTDFKNYGVSVRHADMHNRTVREDFPVERLTFERNPKDGEHVPGDVPAIEWKKDFDGSMKKDCSARNKYLFDVLMKYASERTAGASNKVSGGEPPKPYTGGFNNGTASDNTPSQENSASQEEDEPAHEEESQEAEAPKADPPKKVDPPVAEAPKKEQQKAQKPSAKKEKPDLPF